MSDATLLRGIDEGITALTTFYEVKYFPFVFFGTNTGKLYVYGIEENDFWLLLALDEGITSLALDLDDAVIFLGTDKGHVYSYFFFGDGELTLLKAFEAEITAITNSYKILYIAVKGGYFYTLIA